MSLCPEISVILPVYNAERTIASAVESVLRQSFKNFELLIVNDGSTDSSGSILRAYRDQRIRLIERQRNRGLVAALNDALLEAKGEVIARQDSDDISLPERFASQRAVLQAEPTIGAVGSSLHLVAANGSLVGTWEYPEAATVARWQSLFKTPVAHSAVMFRKRQVLQVGGYSEQFKYAEDYDLWSRLLSVADIRSLRQPLVRYALSPHGVSRLKALEQRAVQCRIAGRNMRELLGTSVSEDVVRGLAIGVDYQEEQITYSRFIEGVRTCTALLDAFIQRNDQSNAAALLKDYRCTLLKLVSMLPYRVKLRALYDLSSIARAGTFRTASAVVETIRTLNPLR